MAPVALLVTGSLGAGKTTLVRYLLAQARRRELVARAYVHTAAAPVDQALLGSQGVASLSAEPAAADWTIVEASALASPHEPAEELLAAVAAPTTVRIAVIDTEALFREPPQPVFLRQLAVADHLVLNKCDLLAEETVAAAHERLAELAGHARRHEASFGAVDVDALLAGRSERAQPDPVQLPHTVRTIDLDAEVSEAEAVAAVLAVGPDRAKGFVATVDRVQVLQVVGPRMSWDAVAQAPPKELIGTVVCTTLED